MGKAGDRDSGRIETGVVREAISVTGMGSGGRYLVSQVKAMRTEIFNTSLSAEGRAVLLYHVERMNEESANALLKVMEEPPEGVLFLLTADSLAGVLPTIRSRCVSFAVAPVSPEECARWCIGQGVDKKQARLYSELFDGHIGTVLAAARDDARREQVEKALTLAKAAATHDSYAAAVLLVLDTFCKGGEVIVSRGELVEIGGSFRIPEVMEKSGARLREVGATNRCHLHDYAAAINEDTRALMRVHTSNYRIVGFHSAVPLPDLAALAREHGLPVIEDLGSGSFMDFSSVGLPNEPTVPEVVAGGADVVTFSGDKVLGGPQCGLIVGSRERIEALKKNPLTRALRCDKLTMAALEATLRLYCEPERARREIPTLRDICRDPKDLARAARSLAARLRRALGPACRISLRPDVSRVGGGAFPERDLPTTLVCLEPAAMSATALKQALLDTTPPVLGRLEERSFCLDPRTLLPEDLPRLTALLKRLLAG